MKPIIAITCDLTEEGTVHRLSRAYTTAIERVGGVPMLIPICEDPTRVSDLLARVDGIALSGGGDLDPACFHERVSSRVTAVSPERDAQELWMTRFLLEHTATPLLGICRGIQVLNVAMGGSLYQDLEESGFLPHMLTMFPRRCPSHSVRLKTDCTLARLAGASELAVNSFHHQAVRVLAPGFDAIAWSEDGVIEAIEAHGTRFALGVQWHPECLTESEPQWRLLRQFIERCQAHP